MIKSICKAFVMPMLLLNLSCATVPTQAAVEKPTPVKAQEVSTICKAAQNVLPPLSDVLLGSIKNYKNPSVYYKLDFCKTLIDDKIGFAIASFLVESDGKPVGELEISLSFLYKNDNWELKDSQLIYTKTYVEPVSKDLTKAKTL